MSSFTSYISTIPSTCSRFLDTNATKANLANIVDNKFSKIIVKSAAILAIAAVAMLVLIAITIPGGWYWIPASIWAMNNLFNFCMITLGTSFSANFLVDTLFNKVIHPWAESLRGN